MKHSNLLFLLALTLFMSCSDDDVSPSVEVPSTYTFERNGASTVSFDGQTTRIMMATELVDQLKDQEATASNLIEMFRNETASGEDANPFAEASLNASTKSIKSKVAASADFYSANTAKASEIKNQLENWISAQVNEVFANQSTVAEPGVAGQIADGSSVRYISADGFEYNQLVAKTLIGGLMMDQMLNNYLSTTVLDEGDNRTDNDSNITIDGTNYTNMEHKWDEAYGYLYGTSQDSENPNATIGADDDFLNEYVGVVNRDEDFNGIDEDIFNAFKLGRAAIVAGAYDVRDVQANIIREKISLIIAVRAVHYLQGGKEELPEDRSQYNLYGHAFHELSEGFGFINSLRFTRMPNSDAPYFTDAEVDAMMEDLTNDGANGLWDVEAATLDAVSETIANKFGFTVAQAAE